VGQGDYNADALVKRGVKCEEVSSVKVHGKCCMASLYEYGDFNRAHDGWNATLKEGDYDIDALEDAGASNNDVSAMVVMLSRECSATTRKYKKREAGGMSVGSIAGSDRTNAHSRVLGDEASRALGSSSRDEHSGANSAAIAVALLVFGSSL
jgi:hypothetical protein